MRRHYGFILFLLTIGFAKVYAQPTNQPVGFTATSLSATSIRLTWTGSTGGTLPTSYLIIAKKNTGGIFQTVTNGAAIADDNDFTDANKNGAYNATHTVGANQYDWISLDPSTLYDFQIYPYTGAGATSSYLSTTTPSSSATTYATEPTNQPTAFTANALSSTSIHLAWTGSTGGTLPAKYLIVAKKTTGGTYITVVDGNDIGDDSDFTDANKNGAYNAIHAVGANQYDWTGLDPATSYDFTIYPYNGSLATINYTTTSAPTSSATTNSAVVEPSNQPTSFTATALTVSSIRLTWTGSTGGTLPTSYLIIAKETTGGTFQTVVDGTGIADDNDFTDANKNGAKNVTHAVGSNQYDMTGLNPATDYSFEIYPYNGSNATADYKTTSVPSSSVSTLAAEPSNQATAFSTTVLGPTSIRLNWTGAIGATLPSNYLIVAKKNIAGAYIAVGDGTPVADDADFSDANKNGAINLVHSVGANQYDWTGLDPETLYDFTIYAYNGVGSVINFNTTSAPSSSKYTLSLEPTAHPSSFDGIASSTTQIDLSFSAANTITNADGYIILRRADGTDPTNTGVADATDPTALALTAGTTRITTITSNSATTFNNNGLTTGTTYNYAIIAYNWDGTHPETYNYYIAPTLLTTSETPSTGITITPANTTSVCQGTSITLTPITLAEVSKSDITSSGTVILELDNLAYSFIPATGTVAVNPSPVGGTNNDIDALTITINASRVTVTYTLDGNNNDKESIIISGLKVTYDGSAPASTAHITRTGGTGTIKGLAGNLATVTAGSTALTPDGLNKSIIACQGDVIVAGPNINLNNTSTRWYSDATLTTEIVALIGKTNINNPALLTSLGFDTGTAGTITRYVTQTPGTCQSSGLAVSLSVQAKPTADLIITSGSNNLCTNYSNGAAVFQTVKFTATPSGAANYTFLKNGSITLYTGTNNFLNATSNDFITGDQVTVAVTVTGSCPSSSNSIVMTKNVASPTSADFEVAFPTANTPATLTAFSNQQDTVRLKGIPTGGSFSGPGIYDIYFRPSGLPIGNNYQVVYTLTSAQGCTSSKSRTFEVYDGTVSIPTLGTSYCSQDPDILITSNSRPGYNLQYIYSPSNYGVNFLPAGSITAANGLDAISTNYPNWLPPNSLWNGSTSTGGPTFTIRPSLISSFNDGTPDGKVTIQFYAAYDLLPADGNPDETRLQTVVFYTRPSIPTASLIAPSFCASDNIVNNTVNITAVTGATIRWFDNSTLTGERLAISVKSKPTFLELGVVNGVVAPYIRYVTQTINGCQSLPQTVTITVNANPSAPIVATPPPYCAGQTIADLSVTATGTIKWYTSLSNIPTLPTPVSTPQLAKASELGIDNTVANTYTRYVTQTINSCESPPTTVTIVVNSIPLPPPVTNANVSFCKGADIDTNAPFNVTSGTNIKWYRDISLSPTALITPISNEFAPTAIELGLTSSIAPSATQFFITQSSGGCESIPRTVSFTINDLTPVSITGGQNLAGVCKTGGLVNLTGSPTGGTWSGSGAAALININSNGTASLDPGNGNLQPGLSYTLIYTSTGGCVNSDQKIAVMLSNIAPSLTVGDACNNSFVSLNNVSGISPALSSATIIKTAWEFGDGDVILEGAGNITNGANAGNTKGTYSNPEHKFKAVGQFSIKYTMTTSENCVVSGSQLVQINPVPSVNFNWSNTCLGAPTLFTSTISNGVPITNYTWSFAKNATLLIGNAGTGANPSTTYSGVGSDIAELIVESSAHCKDTVEKRVYITPLAPTPEESTAYNENFNSGAGGWIAGGANSSWVLGKPTSTIINRDSSANGNGNAWKTNLNGNYNADESSWVLSPCFDFTKAKKPVISLDVWSNTPRGVDGAVLQYNLSGNIENDNDWIVVGTINQGINWYDQTNINSSPGNQSSVDVGWTGDDQSISKYKHWVHATFALDGLASKPNVKFRIAFAGNVSSGEGFAFDNVFIGERSRTILVENFTNSSQKVGAVAHAQNVFYNNFLNSSTEVVKIQYHTSFPGEDPINKENKALYDARSAFYGLTAVPAARLDGDFKDGNFVNWGNSFYLDRVLDPSPIEIQSITTQKDPTTGFVKINTVLKANAKIPKNAYVQTLVVEKQITNAQSAYLGDNGDSEFDFVAKQMLPSPAGIKIAKALNLGDVYNVPELIWEKQNLFTAGSGAIVVFVQQDTLNQKNVYQARIELNPVHPDIVTAIEETGLNTNFSVYPNPTDYELTIQLPQNAKGNIPVKLADQLGKIVYSSSISSGAQTKTINTRDLAEGLYILQIEADGKGTRTKVIVTHKQ